MSVESHSLNNSPKSNFSCYEDRAVFLRVVSYAITTDFPFSLWGKVDSEATLDLLLQSRCSMHHTQTGGGYRLPPESGKVIKRQVCLMWSRNDQKRVKWGDRLHRKACLPRN